MPTPNSQIIAPATKTTSIGGDANQNQSRAADPGQSVWVGASAGSGKTKVLTDRVLRLLLPRSDGKPGTAPEKILCLTFTKIGASEMALRIGQKMAKWAILDEEQLYAALEDLRGIPPDPATTEAARRLFAQVIDAPGGLKILTIHSFCQSVLGRFPVEAGLPPHFSVADDTITRPLQQKAMETVLRQAQAAPTSPLATAIQSLSRIKDEGGLGDILETLMGERTRLFFMQRHFGSLPQIESALYTCLGLAPGDDESTLLQAGFAPQALDEGGLREAAKVMAANKSTTMQDRSTKMTALLDRLPDIKNLDLWSLYATYCAAFLKQDGAPFKDLVVKAIRDSAPDIAAVMAAEAARLVALEDKLKTARCAKTTHDLLVAGLALLRAYRQEKSTRAVLDYDDLIACTLDLLRGQSMNIPAPEAAAWVRYKLDQGIDHILIDEAQDTNPEQWDIIHALCDEFFSGDGARPDIDRTIFAVGDEKQSIFGFQRAAPEKFHTAKNTYATRAQEAGKRFDPVDMTISFRSTPAVLALTDAVFNTAEPWRDLGLAPETIISHTSFRAGQQGSAELWPMIEVDTPPEPEAWALPVVEERSENAETLLATTLATTIGKWMAKGEILPAYNRPIRPGDIMILVRSRGTIVEHLVRAFKSAKIPVSGIDRMVLSDQIAVQDMLAAARFALQPEDDLSLACLLKSPLIGFDEDRLYRTAIDRGTSSLWSSLRERDGGDVTTWLSALIARSGAVHPYEFFSHVLRHPCPADPTGNGLRAMAARLGEDATDPLQEFLTTTLQFEQDNPPSLQQFLRWQAEGSTEIKREQESGSDKIRIMTVHAAKGLQAPIVILPDTVHTPTSIGKIGTAERLIWAQHDGTVLPLWSPRKDDDCSLYNQLLLERKTRLEEEYRRLFYVALTRAADRVIVAGCKKSSRDPGEECWYKMAERAFARLESAPPPGQDLESFIPDAGADSLGWRLSNPQTDAPDMVEKDTKGKGAITPACADWSWLERDPPQEDQPPRPWSPSRPSDPEPAMASPLGAVTNPYRFRRGNATHALLQYLPALPHEQWERAAQYFITGQDLSDAVRQDVVHETLTLLTHPDFTALFGPGSMAEVPITGLIGGKLVSGQIDRLVITDTEILIVDYKTNRPPPLDVKDIPALYRSQMKAYRDTLQKIYPARRIRTFLLWTDGPRMMEVDA